MIGPKQIWGLLRESFNEWQQDKASQLAAALSYYTAVSIAPLLVIVIAIAGLALDREAAQRALVGQMRGLIGGEGAQVVEIVIENADQPGLATLAGILGAITLVWSSANVFSQLQTSLNTIWGVEPKPGKGGVSGLVSALRDRFLSFGMVVVIGFLLLVSLVVSSVLAALGDYLAGSMSDLTLLWQVVNFAISFGVITLLFALLFKVLPDLKIAWRDVWLGAAVTALLFVVGKSLIGYYLGSQSIGSTYGAAGSLVVFLLWVYYSAQIFFFGAEFTQVYATRFGAGVAPVEGARYIKGERPQMAAGYPWNRNGGRTRDRSAPVGGRSPVRQSSSRVAPRIAKLDAQSATMGTMTEPRSDSMKRVQNAMSVINTDEIVAHAEQLQEAAQALAKEMKGQTGQAVMRSAERAKESATKLADKTRRRVEARVDERRAHVADRLENVAHVLHKTSKELHGAKEDALARYTDSAATQFERLATALRPPQSNSLPARISRFAKRRPVLFIISAIATVFALRSVVKSFNVWGPMLIPAIGSKQQGWNDHSQSAHDSRPAHDNPSVSGASGA